MQVLKFNLNASMIFFVYGGYTIDILIMMYV